jgi:hypothetical protein
MSWGKTPSGPPPLLGGAGSGLRKSGDQPGGRREERMEGHKLGNDGTVSDRARANLARMGRGEDIPPRLRDSLAPETRPTATPTPTPAYGENKRKRQIRQQEEAAESPDSDADEPMGHDGNWIAGATKNKGGLHRSLGIPEGKKIPAAKVKAAASKGGKVGKQARLAETLEGLGHDGKEPDMDDEPEPEAAPKKPRPGERKPRPGAHRPHRRPGGMPPPMPPRMSGGAPMGGPPPMAPPMAPPTLGMDGEPEKVHKVMGEFKRGQLHSGSKSGPQVNNRKQAVAIALSEARKGKQ